MRHLANDYGTANNSTVVYQVARGGTCDATSVDNTAKTATLTLNNTDFSLGFYPTKSGTNVAAATLVDTTNLDNSTNQWWVANKAVAIWAPITDVPVGATRALTNTASLIATSVTGQANLEPLASDNSSSSSAQRVDGIGASKTYSTMSNAYSNNPQGAGLRAARSQCHG